MFSLRKKCPNTEFFWSMFSRTWTEYGDIRSKFPYSVQIRKNTDQKNSVFGHISRSDFIDALFFIKEKLTCGMIVLVIVLPKWSGSTVRVAWPLVWLERPFVAWPFMGKKILIGTERINANLCTNIATKLSQLSQSFNFLFVSFSIVNERKFQI